MATISKVVIDKDLESLREVVEGLDDKVQKLSMIRFAVVMLCAVFFGFGIFGGGAGSASKSVNDVRNLAESKGFQQSAIDPFTLLFREPGWTQRTTTDAPEDPETQAKLKELTGKLVQDYQEMFRVASSVLGTDIKLDLRIFILALPLLLPLWHIYIAIYQHKRELLSLIAVQRIQQDPAAAASYDRVLFGSGELNRNIYREYPRRLGEHAYVGTVAFMGCGLLWLTRDLIFATVSDGPTLIILMHWWLALALTCAAFIEQMRRRLSAQFASLFGVQSAEPGYVRAWAATLRGLCWITARISVRLSRPIGALLILMSLFLTTGACEDHRQSFEVPRFWTSSQEPPLQVELAVDSGLSLLLLQAIWLPSAAGADQFGDIGGGSYYLGWAVYPVSIGLALASLFLALPFARGRLPRFRGVFAKVVLAAAIFYFVQLSSFGFLWLGWIVVVLVLATLGFRRFSLKREQWRAWLNVMALPVLVADIYVLIVFVMPSSDHEHAMWGLVVYSLGFFLLAHAAFRDRADALPARAVLD